jgi:hypothetical protein
LDCAQFILELDLDGEIVAIDIERYVDILRVVQIPTSGIVEAPGSPPARMSRRTASASRPHRAAGSACGDDVLRPGACSLDDCLAPEIDRRDLERRVAEVKCIGCPTSDLSHTDLADTCLA